MGLIHRTCLQSRMQSGCQTEIVERPSGTVTFFFTDIEGSTRLWAADPDAMGTALERHDEIVRGEIEQRGGYVFATGGDGFAAAFERAADAVAVATTVQALLGAEAWADGATLRVRIGLHTGEAVERGGDYFGPALNECARLMAIGHGGQVLCSAVTAAVLPEGSDLIDLGEHRLRDLTTSRRVFQIGAEEFPPLRSLGAFRTNLPVQVSRFVGREDELRRVADALAGSRLVTLTGVGGVGKTRLALQAAADAVTSHPDGVWLVELAGLVEPDMVAEAAASTLGVAAVMGTPVRQALSGFVAARRMMVVVDNCEHLIDAAAELAELLVSASEDCIVLATSREGLALRGEQVVPVPPMSIPSEDVLSGDAVRLFVERAAEVRDGFVVSDDEEPALVGLCRRLDGIPLAIELAAARVRSMSLSEILDHIDQRFRLLSAGRRTAPTRQQTLRGAIDWSFGLLEEAEQTLLRRVAVFAGGFDLKAAESVASDAVVAPLEVLGIVDKLVDKSLLVAEEADATTRYRLLETIRDYGLERLEEAGETLTFARRHAEYFAEVSERAGEGLRGPDESRWDLVVETELENMHAALRWAISAQQADLAVRIVAGLAVSGPRLGIPFGAVAAEAAQLDGAVGHRLHPLCFSSAAWSACLRGDIDLGRSLSVRALEVGHGGSGDTEAFRVRCEALLVATSLAFITQGTEAVAGPLLDQAVEVATELGDPYYLSHALTLAYDAESLEEAVRLARLIANPSTLAYALGGLSIVIAAEQPDRANGLSGEAMAHAASVRNAQAGAYARLAMSLALSRLGEDQASAARAALDAAGDLLGTAERFWGLNLLGFVATRFEALGAPETDYLLGAWIIDQGFDIRQWRWDQFGLAMGLSELTDQLTDSVLRTLAPRVATLSDADMIELCRATISQHDQG